MICTEHLPRNSLSAFKLCVESNRAVTFVVWFPAAVPGEDELITQGNMKSISRHCVLGLSALLFFLSKASFAKTLVVYVGSGGDNFA